MTISTPQEVSTQELTLASNGGNDKPVIHTDPRPLSPGELVRVAGGPAIENDQP